MTPLRWTTAVGAGLFLATLPFWRYVPMSGGIGAHMDHEPRHGGQLGMIGEHHVEVVRRRGRVEVFVSDATRRSVRPRSGTLVFDREQQAPLTWDDHRMTAADMPAALDVEARVVLDDGSELAIGFDFAGEGE
jgi:hypothetical protein